MLRIPKAKPSTAAGVKAYFDKELRQGNYYLDGEGHDTPGIWGGQGAQMLGLAGEVERKDFHALCDNLNPSTGDRLTQMTKSNRRVGYDISFNAPKSLSLLYTETRDPKIIAAFDTAVDNAMRRIEADVQARVRAGNKYSLEGRTTDNLVYGRFTHFSARPITGSEIPDPHLHAHCYTFNATFDPVEEKWKAIDIGNVDAPYHEAAFHTDLSKAINELGYATTKTTAHKGTFWEVAGYPRSVIEKFSRRTQQVEDRAKELGLTTDAEKDQLAAQTRHAKGEPPTLATLQTELNKRYTVQELEDIASEREKSSDAPVTHAEALDYAIDHLFEHNSYVTDKKLMREAMRYGYGTGSLTVEGVRDEFEGRSELITRTIGDKRYATTQQVLAAERRVLDYAQSGQDTCSRLGSYKHVFNEQDYEYVDEIFQGNTPEEIARSKQQKEAVLHVLESTDRVIVIRGAAGTGKTTLMKEAVAGIEEGSGKEVFTFAPSAPASRGVLRDEGFDNAETVQRLLVDTKMQGRMRDGVIWVDEAGMLSTKQMKQLVEVADRQSARLVLSGDHRQHTSVEQGEPFRLLMDEKAVNFAEVTTIFRQQDDVYREAVFDLSSGYVVEGFEKLDGLGWIVETEDVGDLHEQLTDDYMQTIGEKGGRGKFKTALVVSPTHREGEKVAALIRDRLRTLPEFDERCLSGEDNNIYQQRNLYWTNAQKGDPRNYQAGTVVQFHQNATGIKRGERLTVLQQSNGTVVAETATGEKKMVPLNAPERFNVYEAGSLALASGERIRITRGGQSKDGHRLENGTFYNVMGFTKDGDIQLSNGWVLDKDFGNLAHGYVTTSHTAQGRTVDRVFIAQSAESFPATSTEQFYVSLSRGRRSAKVYTDDKAMLVAKAAQSGQRMSATEMLRSAWETWQETYGQVRELFSQGAGLDDQETSSSHDDGHEGEHETIPPWMSEDHTAASERSQGSERKHDPPELGH